MSIQFVNDNIEQMERDGAPPITAQPVQEGVEGSQGASVSVVLDPQSGELQRLPRIRGPTMIRKTRETFHNRWPYSIGVAEIFFGFLTLALGTVEAIVVPLALDMTGERGISLDKSNVFGVGIWTGAMLIMTGSLAVRASRTKRATTVYRFYLVTGLCLCVYIAAIILLIVGYSDGWTPDSTLELEAVLYKIHTIMSVTVFIGLLLALVAFVNYYEDVWFGELQLCRRCGKIFCPCVCPKFATSRSEDEELMQVFLSEEPTGDRRLVTLKNYRRI
ncbi:uncharacterized protein LOC135503035 isoform X2 [Lineus longissimus]|uniref:uncharacterized protein LOC135503035 isoform X2 n=1 Tax=Lineus longissimus TaxID=88925 RepID=UPI00315CE3A4